MCGWWGRGCLGGSEWSERHGVGTCVSKWVGVARSSSEHLSAGRRRVALADKVGVGDTRWAPDRDVWLGVTTSAPAKWSHHPTTNHPLTWEQLSDGGPKESPQSRITPPPPPALFKSQYSKYKLNWVGERFLEFMCRWSNWGVLVSIVKGCSSMESFPFCHWMITTHRVN